MTNPSEAKTDLSTPLVVENLSQLAFERLEQAIMLGTLEPGQRISEATLARQLGISRGPLREAVGRLEGIGLVTRVAHQGPRVVSLSTDDLLDLFAIREALEGMACRLAAQNATDDELEELEQMLRAHERDPRVQANEIYSQGRGNQDFHYRIVTASRNQKLKDMLFGVPYSAMRLYRHRMGAIAGRPQKALEEHKAIVAALKTRNPDAAEAAMRAHIVKSRANLLAEHQRMES